MYCIGVNNEGFARGVIEGIRAGRPELARYFDYFTLNVNDGAGVYFLIAYDIERVKRKDRKAVQKVVHDLLESIERQEEPHRLIHMDYSFA